jgi:hypothetical protein
MRRRKVSIEAIERGGMKMGIVEGEDDTIGTPGTTTRDYFLSRVPEELRVAVLELAQNLAGPQHMTSHETLCEITRILEKPLVAYGEREYDEGFTEGTIDAFEFVTEEGANLGELEGDDSEEGSALPEDLWET